ncbi:hypothetical protein NE237_007981 [Protea cynaroides]|uniref:Uncharacterized protein n=1 Tax=Protea cynaroides TaxID=273540 RepID=A0A9Q0KQF8_9MAGN|nr:hypothetical protein NE237_007981 [Protea cynaroides]
MRREGRQHGVVRTFVVTKDMTAFAAAKDMTAFAAIPYYNSKNRVVNRFDTPATAGNFMKVSSKPTNHSKPTGKCSRPRCQGCRFHPVYKSKDKAKGSHKERSYDLVNSIGWNGVGLSYAGFSATAILDQLASRHDHWDDNYDDEEEVEYDLDDVYNQTHDCSYLEDISPALIVREIQEIDHEAGEEEEEEEDDDDDRMSFCEVGFVFELVDEGWCVVAEI